MKTQKISKSDLKVIYDSVCRDWQKKLQDILLWSEGKTVEIPEELIKQGYEAANSEQKQLIEKYFTITVVKPITERVKNFEDILEISGKSLEEIIPWKNAKTKIQKSQNTYAKIQLIEEVLNERHIFDFNNSNEYKYYPYFKWDKVRSCWVYCSSFYFSSSSSAEVAYFKTSYLAEFAGKTFIKEYNDYLNRY